nr:hypothetical protein [uncultured archaeon]
MFDESYKLMKTFEFQTTKEGINELMKNVPEGSTVVIEAGTTGKTLSRMLSEKYVVHMIAPFRRPEIKTDERDSINIVKEDALGYVSRCYIPSPYVEGLRFLSSNMIETGRKAAMIKDSCFDRKTRCNRSLKTSLTCSALKGLKGLQNFLMIRR